MFHLQTYYTLIKLKGEECSPGAEGQKKINRKIKEFCSNWLRKINKCTLKVLKIPRKEGI